MIIQPFHKLKKVAIQVDYNVQPFLSSLRRQTPTPCHHQESLPCPADAGARTTVCPVIDKGIVSGEFLMVDRSHLQLHACCCHLPLHHLPPLPLLCTFLLPPEIQIQCDNITCFIYLKTAGKFKLMIVNVVRRLSVQV